MLTCRASPAERVGQCYRLTVPGAIVARAQKISRMPSARCVRHGWSADHRFFTTAGSPAGFAKHPRAANRRGFGRSSYGLPSPYIFLIPERRAKLGGTRLEAAIGRGEAQVSAGRGFLSSPRRRQRAVQASDTIVVTGHRWIETQN